MSIKIDKDEDLESVLAALRAIEVLGSAKETAGSASQRETEENPVIEALKKTRFRRKPKKKHWKSKLAARRAKGRRDNQIIRNRRKEEWIQKLSDPTDAKAWYDWLARKSNNGWTKRQGWEISLRDFETYVWPRLHGEDGKLIVPTTRRIDTKKDWTLQNVRWYRNGTRELLADGSELYLLKKGYITNENAPASYEDEGLLG